VIISVLEEFRVGFVRAAGTATPGSQRLAMDVLLAKVCSQSERAGNQKNLEVSRRNWNNEEKNH